MTHVSGCGARIVGILVSFCRACSIMPVHFNALQASLVRYHTVYYSLKFELLTFSIINHPLSEELVVSLHVKPQIRRLTYIELPKHVFRMYELVVFF